jgi:hypothetical protein
MPSGWSRALRFALLALLAVAGLTCDDVTFEPGLEVQSALDLSAFVDVEIVPFPAESLIIELRRMSDSSVAVRRAFATDSIEIEGDSAVVEFPITLSTNPESFYLSARVIGEGQTWLEVEDVITVTAGVGASVEELTPVYVGPGADGTSIVLSLSDTTITGGDSLLVTGTVYKGETPVPNAPVGFEVSDTSLVGEPRYLEPNEAWIYAPATLTGEVSVTAVALTRNGSLRAGGTLGFFARPALIEAVSGSNQMLLPGVTAPQPLVVRVRDAAGNPFTRGYPVTFAVQAGPTGTAVTPATVTTDGQGLAQTTLRVGDATGGVTVTATAQDLSGSPVMFNASVLSGNGPEMVIWEGDAQTGTVGTAVEVAPAVIVTNESGAPAEGVSVIFSVTAGGGSVQGGTVVTDAGGMARVAGWTLGTAAGANSLTASTVGLSDVIFTAAGVPDVPSLMALFAGDGQSAEAGMPLANPLMVMVSDQYGNGVEDVPVDWQALHGSVNPTTSTTDASGRAQTSWTLGVNAQTQTVTASAQGTDGAAFTATAIFPNPTILLSLVGTDRIQTGGTEILEVTLTAPAPNPGIVVDFTSDNSSIAFVEAGSVDIPEGEFTAQVNIVGGDNAGSTTIHANASGSGYQPGALTVTVALQVLSIPAVTNVPFGGTTSIPIQLSEAAGVGGEIVTLVSDNPTAVGVTTPTITIAEGQATANGTLSGLLPGTANITATSVNFGNAAGTATTTANLNIIQTSVQATETFGDDITIQLESGGTPIAAPAGGIVVVLTPTDPTCAAVTSPLTIPAGIINTTATVTYGGSATTPCTTPITATASNITQDQVTATVNPPPPISISAMTLASGLQLSWNSSLGAANHGGITVTIASDDPSLVLVSPDAATPGTASIQIAVPDLQSFHGYFLQAVEGQTGSATVTVSAPGFVDGVATATVVQPGVQIGGIVTTTTTLSPDSPFFVQIGVPNGNGISPAMSVRAGSSPITATVTSNPAAIAELANSSGAQGGTIQVQVPVGQSNSPTSLAAGGIALSPLSAGETTVSASIPGFVTVANGTRLVNVTQPNIGLGAPTVASGLQRSWSGNLAASAHGGVTLTISSDDDQILQVSPDVATPGTTSIQIDIPDGQTFFSFYLQGVEGQTGAPMLTASAPGFGPISVTGTVVQPGVVLSGLAANTTTLTADDAFVAQVGIPSGVGISPVLQVRPGGSLPVTFTSSAPAIAQLVTADGPQGGTVNLTIAAGQLSTPSSIAAGGVALEPLTEGRSDVAVSIPGFVQPTNATVSVNVTQPAITVNDPIVASGLQRSWTGSLGASDHGGVDVVITSSNPQILLLSSDATTAGMGSISISVPNGQANFGFHVQGVESATGTPTFTASAPGFADAVSTATVVQPGVIVSGLSTSITTLSPDDPFVAVVGIPSGTSSISPALNVRAGGSPLTVTFTSSAPTVGRLVNADGPVGGVATATIPVGLSNTGASVAAGGVAFEPLTEGTTQVQAGIPGFAQQTNATVTVDVAQPGITVTDVTVPAGLQRNWSGFLAAPNHGGVDVILTSSNPGALLLSPDATTAGTASIQVSVLNGQTGFGFHVQGVEGQSGANTTIIATASGFNDGSATASVVMPGIVLVGLNSTHAADGANDDFWAQVGLPTGSGLAQALAVRAGAPQALTVTFTSNNPSAAQLVDQSQSGGVVVLQIPAGEFRTAPTFGTGGVALDPLAPGSTTVSVGATGYTSPQQATVQVTVNP